MIYNQCNEQYEFSKNNESLMDMLENLQINSNDLDNQDIAYEIYDAVLNSQTELSPESP